MKFILIGIIFSFSTELFCQDEKKETESGTNKIYKSSKLIEAPIYLGLIGTNIYGLVLRRKKEDITLNEILALDQSIISSFDRNVFNFNPAFRNKAANLSDIGMFSTLLAPIILFLNKDIRSDWENIAYLFIKTEIIAANLYSWAGPHFFDRNRPITYFDSVPLIEKTGSHNKHSFFSGHTSTTASASFFMAKIYTDYHQELGLKKIGVYTLAAVPPLFVGYMRMRALKHFPTDILVGTIVGAATGILVPHFHKIRKNKKLETSIFMMENGAGLYCRYFLTR